MKKIVSILVLVALVLTLIPVSFAASSATTKRDNAVFAGYEGGVAQYVQIGEDMNGSVAVSSNDSNPVPTYAQYENGFYVQGAQLRVESSSVTGLRFIIVNNLDMISAMTNAELGDISYGALVEIDTGANLNLKNSVMVPADSIYQTQTDLGTDYQKYTVCITGVDDSNLRTDIAVRPYLTYTDLNGNTQTLYGEQYRCDMYSLAYDAYNYGGQTNTVKNALNNSVLTPYNNSIGNNGTILSGEYELNANETTFFINSWRRKTDSRISEIKNTPNMEIPENATVYYVSNNGNDSNDGLSPETAWQTIEKVNSTVFNSGDYVLFERGGVFRSANNEARTNGDLSTLNVLIAQQGVTYSAYGIGEKPVITASPENGAVASRWTEVEENIWKYTATVTWGKFWNDIGSIYLRDTQGNETYATKLLIYKTADGTLQEYKTKETYSTEDYPAGELYKALDEDLEFLHYNKQSSCTYYVYLYSEQNPGERFESIEFLQHKSGIYLGTDVDNVTIDNLCIKYVGAHGVEGGTRTDITVQNCTFEYIGGSIQTIKTNDTNSEQIPVRYGNGVQIYGGCDGFTVENCYFSNMYDAAVTHQYEIPSTIDDTVDRGHYNVLFKDNVMEYCTYSIEYFLGKSESTDANVSIMDNVVYEGNLMWYAGEGMGSQRPDETTVAHIKGWTHWNDTKTFTIKNNFMAYSTAMFVHGDFRNKNSSASNKGVTFQDNVIVGVSGQQFGFLEYRQTANSWGGSFVVADYTPGSTQTKIQGSGLQNVNATGNRYYFVTR